MNRISRLCRAIIGHDQLLPGSNPEGELPSVIHANSYQEQKNAIQQILDNLLKNEGLQSRQIAILVAGGIAEFSDFNGLKKIGKHSLAALIKDWRSDQGVLLESSKKFKGLEADVVILADMPSPEAAEYFTESDLYVSASRGKHRLFIICKNPAAQKYASEKVEESKAEIY